MYFWTTPGIIIRSWCSNGWRGRDAGSGCIHPVILPASGPDRTIRGIDAPALHPQQMLRWVQGFHPCGTKFSTREGAEELACLLRPGHRQLPRYRSRRFSGSRMSWVYIRPSGGELRRGPCRRGSRPVLENQHKDTRQSSPLRRLRRAAQGLQADDPPLLFEPLPATRTQGGGAGRLTGLEEHA
jgi:hypothetical protein